MKRSVLVLLLSAGLLSGCDAGKPAPAPEDAAQASPYAAADDLMRARDFTGARKALEALAAGRGLEPELALRLGVVCENLGDPARAVVTYREALEAHPGAAKLWVALGNTCLELGQFERAREALQRGRELGIEDKHTALALGICLAQLGQIEAADEEFVRALAAGADASHVGYNVALLRVAAKRYREAKDILEGLVAENPEHYEAQRELGSVLVATTDDPETIERALRIAWDVVDHRPEDWRAHKLLGDAFMARQDYEAAVEAYTEALRFGQNPPEVEERWVEATRSLRAMQHEHEDDEARAGQPPAPVSDQPEKLSR